MFFPRPEGSSLVDGFTTGLDASSLWCSTEGGSEGPFVSPAALQFLLSDRFVSRRHCPFAN